MTTTLDILTLPKSYAFHLPTVVEVRERKEEEKETKFKNDLNADRICIIPRTHFKKKVSPCEDIPGN
jgi:hypothetical protein